MRVRRWVMSVVVAVAVGGWAPKEEAGSATGLAATSGRGAPTRLAGPTKGDRVLVIAPHCDDEAVACGGLIQQAVEVGAQVRVVIITNGDAFRVAAEHLYGTTALSPEHYRRMGKQRQGESLAGLARLGVSRDRVTFLGYPDAGTAQMWLKQWEPGKPYTSTRTKADHSPYANSFRRNAPYCGRFLLDDVKTVMAQFRPTIVAMPHPADRHSDHWAGYCYGTAALYELGRLGKVRSLLYLIHEYGYPKMEENSRAIPAPAQPEEWKALTLSARQQRVKRTAIGCQKTQCLVLRDFMVSFAGPVEWYAEAQVTALPPAPGRHIAPDGDGADWSILPTAVTDPADGLETSAAKVVSLRVCRGDRHLYLVLALTAPASPGITYELHLHPLRKGLVGAPMRYVITPGGESKGVTARAKGRLIEAEVPLAAGITGLLLCADTHREGKTVDRTPWVVTLSPPY